MDASPFQPALFEADRVLVDDALGRIAYTPDFLAPSVAAAAFDALLHEVPWRGERRRMYEREIDTPRLIASFALVDSLPAAIAALVPRVGIAANAAFTHVGLNLYRDGHDSVAPHNDRLEELRPGAPIALVSLGAPRDMIIRAKRPPRRVLRVVLEAGSLLVMSYACQLHYDHGIPKQRAAAGPRISLAFRARTLPVSRRS